MFNTGTGQSAIQPCTILHGVGCIITDTPPAHRKGRVPD